MTLLTGWRLSLVNSCLSSSLLLQLATTATHWSPIMTINEWQYANKLGVRTYVQGHRHPLRMHPHYAAAGEVGILIKPLHVHCSKRTLAPMMTYITLVYIHHIYTTVCLSILPLREISRNNLTFTHKRPYPWPWSVRS